MNNEHIQYSISHKIVCIEYLNISPREDVQAAELYLKRKYWAFLLKLDVVKDLTLCEDEE